MKTEKSPIKLVALIIIILAVIAVLFTFISSQKEGVAMVNGKSISKSEYDKEYNFIKKQLEGISEKTFDSEAAKLLQENVVNHLIDLTLVKEYAEKNNITFSEEEFNAEYATRVALLGGEEAYRTYLKQYSLPEETFKKDMENELILIKSIKHKNGDGKFLVTEEEIRAAYDSLVLEVNNSGLNEEIPAYEGVKSWFAKQLENQKIIAESEVFLEFLRSEADIEILI